MWITKILLPRPALQNYNWQEQKISTCDKLAPVHCYQKANIKYQTNKRDLQTFFLMTRHLNFPDDVDDMP